MDKPPHAAKLSRTGEDERAQAEYEQILRRQPDHRDALAALWDLAYETGDHRAAINGLRRAIAADPQNAQFHYMLGCSLQMAGTPHEAIASFRSALALDPGLAKAHNNLGCLLQADGQIQAAAQCYRDAIAADPTLASAHCNLGYACSELGDSKQAIASFKRATQLEPAHADWHGRLGDMLLDHASFDEALSCYRAALKIDRSNASAVFGQIIALRARYWEALERSGAQERGAPTDRQAEALALFLQGRALQRAGSPELAVQSFESALQRDPEAMEVHFFLGYALKRLSHLGQAHEHFRQALRLRLLREPRIAPPSASAPAVRVPRTTLCCVDCRYPELAIAAIRKSMSQCWFERVKFFTDRRFELDGIDVVVIPRIKSVEEYCQFMVKELGRHIETEFALVIQYDGYVLSGRRWDDRFLDYDYIGAKWSYTDGRNVGNGGFSLRSRRLLAALGDQRIAVAGTEDIAICRTYRGLLERDYGIRFAPEDVAERFSFEAVPPPGATFGFHGMSHLPNIVDMTEEELAAYRAPLSVYSRPG